MFLRLYIKLFLIFVNIWCRQDHLILGVCCYRISLPIDMGSLRICTYSRHLRVITEIINTWIDGSERTDIFECAGTAKQICNLDICLCRKYLTVKIKMQNYCSILEDVESEGESKLYRLHFRGWEATRIYAKEVWNK